MSTTQFLETSGGRIAYDDTGGAGPLLVAAPGIGDTRRSYRHLSPRLVSAGMRLVTFDLRGLGESSARWDDYSDAAIASDYLSLLDRLDAPSAFLVGNSKSASSAVIAAASDTRRVKGLILLGPFAREAPLAWWQGLLFGLMLAGPWGRAAWMAYYKKSLFPGQTPDDHRAYTASLAGNLAEPGRFRAVRMQAKDSHTEAGSKLKQVTQPSLIIMGTADPDFPDPVKEAHELARTLGGRVVLAEGSGHYPQADNPELVADAIVDFIRQGSSKGESGP